MSFISIFAISCSSDSNDVTNTNNSENVSSTLLITTDYISKGKTMVIPKEAEYEDFFFDIFPCHKPTYPNDNVRVHFITKEATETYKIGDVVKSVDMYIGKNDIQDLPRLRYDVVVTNYKKTKNNVEDLEWIKSDYAIDSLPDLSDKIYLFSKTTIDFRTEKTPEIKVANKYALVKLLRKSVFVEGYLHYKDVLDPESANSFDYNIENSVDMINDNSHYYYIFSKAKHTHVFYTHYVPNLYNQDVEEGGQVRLENLEANNVYIIAQFHYMTSSGSWSRSTNMKELAFNDAVFK